jgi:hypothetical protein
MRRSVFALLLISCEALADNAAQYDVAFNNIKTATLIQSGVQAKIDALGHYAEQRGQRLLEDLHLDKPTAIGYYCYKVYREQSLTIPVAHDKRLTLQPSTVVLTITYSF